MASRTGIILLNLGGPDSLQAVKPFLYNLFSDPDILKLPLSGLLQSPLAWLITTLRGKEAEHNYSLIGGRSPILPQTQAQAEALHQQLQARGYGDIPVYIAMRYWRPFTEAAVRQMMADEVDYLIVLPLYPQFSYTTTGSSVNELERVLKRLGSRVETQLIPPYYQHPAYLASLAATVQEALENPDHPWSVPPEQVTLLFSAHSLPKRHIKRTQDPYPEQLGACARSLIQHYFPHNPWDMAFQSKVGRMPWLGPSTDGVLHYYAALDVQNVLLIPISFVSDHIETLFEIDQLYVPLGRELGIAHVHRSPALNQRPLFIEALAQLVSETLTPTGLNQTCSL